MAWLADPKERWKFWNLEGINIKKWLGRQGCGRLRQHVEKERRTRENVNSFLIIGNQIVKDQDQRTSLRRLKRAQPNLTSSFHIPSPNTFGRVEDEGRFPIWPPPSPKLVSSSLVQLHICIDYFAWLGTPPHASINSWNGEARLVGFRTRKWLPCAITIPK